MLKPPMWNHSLFITLIIAKKIWVVKIKYETEKYVCVKTDKMDKFNKKWTLPLDSVPLNVCPWNALIIFCIVTRAFKFIVYRIVMYL